MTALVYGNTIFAKALQKLKLVHIVSGAAIIYLCSLTKTLSTVSDVPLYVFTSRYLLSEGILKTITVGPIPCGINYIFVPLTLSLFSAVAADNFLLMKLLSVIATIISVLLFHELLKGLCEENARKLLTALFALNPWVLEYSQLVTTDMPYIAFLLAAFVSFKEYNGNKRARSLFFCLLSILLCIITRPIGYALIPSLFIALAITKRRRALIALSTAMLLAILMLFPYWVNTAKLIINNGVRPAHFYSPEAGSIRVFDLAYRAVYQLLAYAGNYLPDILLKPLVIHIDPRLGNKALNPLFLPKFLCGMMLFATATLGFLRSFKKEKQLFHAYCLFHMAILLINNVYVSRYLASLLPVIIFSMYIFFFSGRDIFRRIGLGIGITLILLYTFNAGVQVAHARTGYEEPEIRSFLQCHDWIKANTPQDSQIMSCKPDFTYLYSKRDCVGYSSYTLDYAKQYNHILDSKADYCVIGDAEFFIKLSVLLLEIMKNHPENFKLVYESDNLPKNYVYEVMKRK